MKVLKESNGNIVTLDDTTFITSSNSPILDRTVVINKAGSSSFGKKAEIVGVRHGKILVQKKDGSYGTYDFDALSQATIKAISQTSSKKKSTSMVVEKTSGKRKLTTR